MRILLDMDGCVADFISAALHVHNVRSPYGEHVGDNAWDITKVLGISHKEFFAPFDRAFWRAVPKTEEADAIVGFLSDLVGRQNICLLTSPCKTPGCLEGKSEWRDKYYPHLPMLLSSSSKTGAPPKHFLASPDCILVDDHTANVDLFKSAGGRAFLLPRLWNREWQRADSVMSELEKFFLDGNK